MIVLVGGLAMGGCVLPPPPGAPVPPRVEVLASDARAARYGTGASQMFEHPALRDRVRALFGADWSDRRARWLSAPAPVFFAKSSPPRMLRIGNADWIAVIGCAPTATHRGLLLVSADGERLFARIDEGGATHDYGFGPGMASALGAHDRVMVDAAWRALESEFVG
jgi:hypothetical protein